MEREHRTKSWIQNSGSVIRRLRTAERSAFSSVRNIVDEKRTSRGFGLIR
jgi:hypothetical protein